MVGWVLAATGYMLMLPVLRRISEYQRGRVQQQRDNEVAQATSVPPNLQDAFEPVMGDEFVFGGAIESAQEGAGTDGSEELAICR